jgi:hypothetical protein
MLNKLPSSPLREYARVLPLLSLALMLVTAVSPSATVKSPGLLTFGATFTVLPLPDPEPHPPSANRTKIEQHRPLVVFNLIRLVIGQLKTLR